VIPRFALARPADLAGAFAAWDDAGGDAAWYAGGTELLQVMKMGLARFGTLIDLKGLAELRGIHVDGSGDVTIGAGTTHREIERSEPVRRRLPGLSELAAHVANIRVRNQGTIGGNLCFAEPHSDPAAFLIACGASVRLAGPGGSRDLPLASFCVASFETARRPEEILVSVTVPGAAPGEGRAYRKAKFRERPAVSVAVRLQVRDGAIADATVVVGSMTGIPTRVQRAEAALAGVPAEGRALDETLARAAATMADLDAEADLDGSPEFKRHLAGVLLGRAARAALEEATSA
jgi:carbon-monoxide dehydrogenase medium subunit